jgi:HORMA domain.
MSTSVAVHSYVYSVNFVTDKMLLSLKEVIRESGLNPAKMTDDWAVLEAGIRTWLEGRYLERLVLEVYSKDEAKLVHRWDFDIDYDTDGDGSMWVDTDEILYNLRKAGLTPKDCEYRFVAINAPGWPQVNGWSATTLRATDGFVRQSIGRTIDGSGIAASTAYWRRT